MKKLILSELILIFLATTFIVDSPTPGWFQQTLPTSKPVSDIYFIDSLHGWVSVSSGQVYDSAKILATSDGGNNWVTQFAKDTMILNAIQFLNLNTGYCVGGFREVLKTTNSGQNWVPVNSPGTEYFTDLFFVNTDTGWICDPYSFGGLFKTINGGISWQQQLVASYLIKKLFFLNTDTGWASSNDGRLYRTINGGLNWNLLHTFSSSTSGIYFITGDTGFIAGDFGNSSIGKTTNGGFNWFPTNNAAGGYNIFFITEKLGFDCSVVSVIEKTTDGGNNWFRQTVPSGDYYSIQFTDTTQGWSGGSKLIHTLDGGGPPIGIHGIGNDIPSAFILFQNYPNPFNPRTKIKYQIAKNKEQNESVKISVFDISGKKLIDMVNESQRAGEYEVDFDGSAYSSGIYFYSLIIDGNLIETKRMILLK